MASHTIKPQHVRAALPARRPVFRYVLLACIFAIAVGFQLAVAIGLLHRTPVEVASFAPDVASATIEYLDSKASEAGLHRGDVVVAVNGHPYTGIAVLWEQRLQAVPGSTMAVTVRSPGASPNEHTVLLPVTPNRRWYGANTTVLGFGTVVPAFCIALGFWVVLIRPNDPLAWLLLGLLLSFTQAVLWAFLFVRWGTTILRLAVAYNEGMQSAWPIFMFLFGFFFPEPLPYFQQPGTWRKWAPWIAVLPFAVFGIAGTVFSVFEVTDYSTLASIHHLLRPLGVVLEVYAYCLVGAFFGFIFTKSAISLSPDGKRRLRLLYWGATISFTPVLLISVLFWSRKMVDFPDSLIAIEVLCLMLFPLTLAYVVVVQRAMDVRVVLRQGLQYGLAKNGIRVLQAIAIMVVTLTALALVGRSQASPQKLVVIAIGLVAVFTIRRMSEKLGAWTDRRFFREAYDAEQVLVELSDGVRGMVEARSLIETVAERISETLHIPRIAVMLGGVGPYRPAFALGYGSAPDIVFSPGAGTVKVLQRQKEPARVYFDDPNSWLYREPEVTEDDRSKLTQLDAELLLPISARNKLLGFISLGPKLSDEPYSRADLRLLKSVAAQTGLALENAQLISEIADEVAQRERLNREVEIAREVQERLFPQTLPAIAGILYAGACRSAFGVGGDYYDFLALPAGKLGIAIGDVSGKGIAAALTMASLQASLRSEATRAPDNLAGMMCDVNRLVFEASAANRYATFFYAQYNPASRQLDYVNAGHNPPMLFHPSAGEWQVARLEACGTVVGLLEDARYQQAALTIAPGDILIAFTDGISEAMNCNDDEFGEDRLIETVKNCGGLAPSEIISRIMRAADVFAAGAKQNDDMTVVVLCAQAGPAS